MNKFAILTIIFCIIIIFPFCSVSSQIQKTADTYFLKNPLLKSAHAGICIFDPAENKYLYQYQSDKYFTPASNTKIITCYAAMKYLGDSLAGLKVYDYQNALLIRPTGDPTLLHPDFKANPVVDFLSKQSKTLIFLRPAYVDEPLGKGWAWDDYPYYYSAERSRLPVFGNVVTVYGNTQHYQIEPAFFDSSFNLSEAGNHNGYIADITREQFTNRFIIDSVSYNKPESDPSAPFITSDSLAVRILSDSIHKKIDILNEWKAVSPLADSFIIYSQPTDTLLRIMMHRSDNFYAEQFLLMVSDKLFGVMNDKKIIDTLLATDYKDMPQQPAWVDGSGLSRYNLFTPEDLVFVLNKMKNEFAWNRLTDIFATGGSGTLGNAYRNLEGKIFAKTGSLSHNLALSGYLVTQKNRTLIFSVMVSNYMVSSSAIRMAIAGFLEQLVKDY